MSLQIIPVIMVICIQLLFIIGCCKDDDNSNPTQSQNHAPVIQAVTASPDTIIATNDSDLSCVATDVDGDSLAYTWASPSGGVLYNINNPTAEILFYSSTGTPVDYYITVYVSDGIDFDCDSVLLVVQ